MNTWVLTAGLILICLLAFLCGVALTLWGINSAAKDIIGRKLW